jgi:hypothetical protein
LPAVAAGSKSAASQPELEVLGVAVGSAKSITIAGAGVPLPSAEKSATYQTPSAPS